MRAIAVAFFALLLVAGAQAATGAGVRGRVTSSPTCPVERYPPDPQCAPRGVKAHISVRRASDRRLVRTLDTASDGRFTIRLRPGRYLLRASPARGGALPRCPGASRVTVTSGRYTRVAIDCDSGIR
jgi:hypothetical protein